MMKNLGNLSPAPGSHRTRKRLGRGIGSGLGKTAGKGHKGQKARKSSDVATGFEGGQTPFYRRIPKFGFKTDHRRVIYNIIDLNDLNLFSDGETVNRESLLVKKLLKYQECPVKILANGELKRKLTISVEKMSASAKAAIEKAGGNFQGNN